MRGPDSITESGSSPTLEKGLIAQSNCQTDLPLVDLIHPARMIRVPPDRWNLKSTTTDLDGRLVLSLSKASKALGASEWHLRSMLPELPHVDTRVVVPIDALREWLRARRRLVA